MRRKLFIFSSLLLMLLIPPAVNIIGSRFFVSAGEETNVSAGVFVSGGETGDNSSNAVNGYCAAADLTTDEPVETVTDTADGDNVGTLPQTLTVLDADTGECFECGFEEYIAGVVAAEMPCTFHTEALKAQAVAARSYTIYKLTNFPSVHSQGADVCTDFSCCKAYISYEQACERWGKESADTIFTAAREAAFSTAGELLCYEREPACAVFHSSSDGCTESSANVWGGSLPYLVSRATYEDASVSESSFDADGLKSILTAAGYETSGNGFSTTLNDSGRVAALEICGVTLSGGEARRLFGLRSTDFSLEFDGGEYIFTVKGYGHGVGMSQYGAQSMAERGYSYKDILCYYYSGCEIAAFD